jgi:hypothetical protein
VIRPSRARLVLALLAATCWATAVFCARGTLAVTAASPDAPRVGLLPPLREWLVLLAAGWLVAASPRVRCLPLAPVFLSALAVLPWIPYAPAPLLVWTGRATGLVWMAVAGGLVAAHTWPGVRAAARRLHPWLADARRAPWTAAATALLAFSVAAWRVAPSVPGGDEPHYLVITQSLLADHDLKIENNHRRRDYAAYFPAGELKPDYLRRGRDGEIYSVHAPGLPALVAPAFAIGGYPAVKGFLLILAAVAAGLVWRLAHDLSGDAPAAWFGWAAVCVSASWVFHTFTVYPDGVGALLVLLGVWTLVRVRSGGDMPAGAVSRRRLVLTGAGLALLPWLHTRFVLLAAALGTALGARLVRHGGWRAGGRQVAWLLAVPAASAAAWFGFFRAIYGTFDPLAPYGTFFRTQASWAFVTSGLGGLFFDQQFGLLPYAPVLVAAFVGLGWLARDRAHRGLVIELALLMVPYLVAVTHVRMWWAGWSAPARFVVPVLLPLAAPAAVAWARAGRATRATFAVALGFTVFATGCLVCVDGGRLAYNVRDGYALWLEWLSQTTVLALGVPSFHRTSEAAAWVQVGVWGAVLLAAWWALVWLERTRARSREALATAAPAVFAVAVMIALAAVWRMSDSRGLSPATSQIALLRHAASAKGMGVADRPLRFVDAHTLPGLLAIEAPPRWLAHGDETLFAAPDVPAGMYGLDVEVGGNPAGELRVGVGRQDLPLVTLALAQAPPRGPAPSASVARVEVRLPVGVRALVVRGDEAARRAVSRIRLRPLALSSAPSDLLAGQAVRYPGGTVFFLDDGAFPEPDAFWVRGGRETTVVVDAPGRPAGGGRVVPLGLRNAPVANELAIDVGAWRERVVLGPREERVVAVPLPPSASAARVRLAARTGFRPIDWERGSEDARFLGVRVTLRP